MQSNTQGNLYMNRYEVLIIVLVLGSAEVAFQMGLNYSQCIMLFSFVAVAMAPIAIHKTESRGSGSGFLVGLAFFVSIPIARHFNVDSVFKTALIALPIMGLLWIVGLGWKRKLK
jgi:hypothetical protein